MNHAVVVDASVAVKWVLDEEFTEQARAVLRDSVRRPIVAPPHLTSEVTNALHQRVRVADREKRISEPQSQEALALFLSFRIEFQAPATLYQQSLAFAQINRLSHTYDSLYVILAQMVNAELWTGDRRLLNSIRRVAPWVRWIGDYPLP